MTTVAETIQMFSSLMSGRYSPKEAAQALGRQEGSSGRVVLGLVGEAAAFWPHGPPCPMALPASPQIKCPTRKGAVVSTRKCSQGCCFQTRTFWKSKRGFSIWNVEGGSSQDVVMSCHPSSYLCHLWGQTGFLPATWGQPHSPVHTHPALHHPSSLALPTPTAVTGRTQRGAGAKDLVLRAACQQRAPPGALPLVVLCEAMGP